MIYNFEDLTYDLRSDELTNIIPKVLGLLYFREGIDNAITNDGIVSYLRNQFNIKTSNVRIRSMIRFIRMSGLLVGLVAGSKGYYIENDIDRYEKYVEGLYDRSSAILSLHNHMKFHSEYLRERISVRNSGKELINDITKYLDDSGKLK